MKTRIKKVCAGFHASLYTCPNTKTERLELETGLRTRLEDLNLVIHLMGFISLFSSLIFVGFESNSRPSPKGFSKRSKRAAELEHYGS